MRQLLDMSEQYHELPISHGEPSYNLKGKMLSADIAGNTKAEIDSYSGKLEQDTEEAS